jgi:hypothetical protein
MKITTLTMGCFLLAAVLGAQSSQASRKAQGLIQAAQAKEAVQGDLKGAIELYRRAAREAGSDQATATPALLALAACYKKQGASGARKVYEEIVVKYPGQTEAVAIARQKLGQSGQVHAGGPRVRQLWADPEVDAEGSVSPDGRWLTYATWATGDLGVRDLSTGTNRLLTNTGGWEKSGGAFATDSVYSPDGKLIAYNWFIRDKDHELRLMNADGSGVRTLFRKPGWVMPQAWSLDKRTIGVVHYDVEGMNSLQPGLGAVGRISPGNCAGEGAILQNVFLPRRRLARPRHERGPVRVLGHLSGSIGRRRPRQTCRESGRRRGARLVAGREAYLISNRGGSYGLWRLPVADGKASGPASLVKGDLGASIWPIGFTRSGSYVYHLDVGGNDVYEVGYDPAAGRFTSKPWLVSDRVPGRNRMPASYSPDGRYLAWLRTVPHGRGARLWSCAFSVRAKRSPMT